MPGKRKASKTRVAGRSKLEQNVPSWREFEQLVARIESTLSPSGAIIKSPDSLAASQTGTLREVDASIRYKVGTAEVLISLECRKREPRQDVTWIEQLIEKRRSLNISKTVAISSNGFTREAHSIASANAIETRVLTEITPEAVTSWLSTKTITAVDTRAIWDSMNVILLPHSGSIGPASIEIDTRSKLFENATTMAQFSANDLIRRHLNNHFEVWDDVELGGSTRKQLRFEVPDLTIRVSGTIRSIACLEYSAILTRSERVVPFAAPFEYRDQTDQLAQGVEAALDAPGLTTRVTFIRDATTGRVLVQALLEGNVEGAMIPQVELNGPDGTRGWVDWSSRRRP